MSSNTIEHDGVTLYQDMDTAIASVVASVALFATELSAYREGDDDTPVTPMLEAFKATFVRWEFFSRAYVHALESLAKDYEERGEDKNAKAAFNLVKALKEDTED